MKILEKTTSKDKNKVIEIVSIGKKKYKRISDSNKAEWRRYKTNHQVKADEHKSLEEDYGKVGFITIRSMPNVINNSAGRLFSASTGTQSVIQNNGTGNLAAGNYSAVIGGQSS